MASMDDLIATINGNLHAGQQGEDLKELHVRIPLCPLYIDQTLTPGQARSDTQPGQSTVPPRSTAKYSHPAQRKRARTAPSSCFILE